MTVWTVLAPGPSLKDVTLQHLLKQDGPIVAVNMAVLSPHRKDFWCCQDPAKKFQTGVWGSRNAEEKSQLPVVWCRARNAKQWQEIGIRVWPHPDVEGGFRDAFLPGSMKTTKKSNFTNLTILTAITRCIGHGAEKVVVYGCDMGGRGYAYGPDPANRAPAGWDKRWTNEPKLFNLAVEEWEKHGVQVERRRP